MKRQVDYLLERFEKSCAITPDAVIALYKHGTTEVMCWLMERYEETISQAPRALFASSPQTDVAKMWLRR